MLIFGYLKEEKIKTTPHINTHPVARKSLTIATTIDYPAHLTGFFH